MKIILRIVAVISLLTLSTPAVQATPIVFDHGNAVVKVHCGNRQGSGVAINGQKGYVLTNAHVLLDLKTFKPGKCYVGFTKGGNTAPTIYYTATWEKYVFEEERNQDFAILKILDPLGDETLPAFPFLKTDEFSKVGDPIYIVGFPSNADGQQRITEGTISDLEQGIIKTDAEITSGMSGGAGVDKDQNLIGIATRIRLREVKPGIDEVVNYELVDLRAILNWLDTFGVDSHDDYVTHADFDRYHGPQGYIRHGKLNCILLVKSPLASTVYCLRADVTRTVFPNDDVFHSWFADFSGVETVPPEQLAAYRLKSNVTLRPGSLIKIETDPKVYLVSDIDGTIRWLENENIAKELYGDGWAGFVKDVPVTFFMNYTLGAPIK